MRNPPPEGDGWRLRPYRPGDERWIVARFESVFGRAMNEEHWRWKLKTRPSPAENVWLGVDREDRPIFHYAAMPRRLLLPDGEVEALVLVDLWTAPELRGRRIFTRCAAWVHDEWRRSGVACVFSPFNARSEPRYRRLGWQLLVSLRWQLRPLRPEVIAARRLRLPALGRLRRLGDGWNRIWDRRPPGLEVEELAAGDLEELPALQPAGGVGFERDASWLRWRYLDCPRHGYSLLAARRGGRPLGYLAYRVEEVRGQPFGFVAEVAAVEDDPQLTSALMVAALECLKARGAVAVATLAIPGSEPYRAWRRKGFLWSWGSFFPHVLPLDPDLPLDVLRDPQRWDMAGGDYDVI